MLFCTSSFVSFLPFPGCFNFGKTLFFPPPPSTVLERVWPSRAQIPAPCCHQPPLRKEPSVTLAPTCVQKSLCPPPSEPCPALLPLSGTSLPQSELDFGQGKLSTGINDKFKLQKTGAEGGREPGYVCFPLPTASKLHPHPNPSQRFASIWMRMCSSPHELDADKCCPQLQGETSTKTNGL